MFPELFTSFTVGVAATSSPCVLLLYPGYIAYLASGSRNSQSGKGSYFLGLLVLLGVLVAVLALGLIVAYASLALGDVLVVAAPIADILVISLGILLILGKNPFVRLAQMKVPVLANPYAGSFTYGLLYGPIILPCSGPLAVSIFALSFSASQLLEKLSVFLVFGLGMGIPLLVISLLAAAKRDWLARQLTEKHAILSRLAGIILIGVGIWNLNNNVQLLSAYL
jgi:cytochrome c-type biogenesis protein